jgi:uncharacterized protein YndB with AHSA1/START domain
VGGTYKMSFTNFGSGETHSFGGEYRELVPYQRIRYTHKFDDPNLPGEIQVTITLKKAFWGTELTIVQEGVPDVIPPDACYLGWQESLALLLGANCMSGQQPFTLPAASSWKRQTS